MAQTSQRCWSLPMRLAFPRLTQIAANDSFHDTRPSHRSPWQIASWQLRPQQLRSHCAGGHPARSRHRLTKHSHRPRSRPASARGPRRRVNKEGRGGKTLPFIRRSIWELCRDLELGRFRSPSAKPQPRRDSTGFAVVHIDRDNKRFGYHPCSSERLVCLLREQSTTFTPAHLSRPYRAHRSAGNPDPGSGRSASCDPCPTGAGLSLADRGRGLCRWRR